MPQTAGLISRFYRQVENRLKNANSPNGKHQYYKPINPIPNSKRSCNINYMPCSSCIVPILFQIRQHTKLFMSSPRLASNQ